MEIVKKARKWMEKYTGTEPKEGKEKHPTAFTTRKKQGPGMW